MTRKIAVRVHARATLASCVGAVLAGCAGSGDGLDALGRPPGGNGSPPPPPAEGEFQQIQDTILTPICVSCHAGASAPVGLRLDAGSSYAMLVNVPSAEVPALLRVAPGDPQNSYLVQKLEGSAAVGARMPLGAPPLPQTSIDLVRSWIAAGAMAPTSSLVGESSFTVLTTVPAESEASVAPVETLQIIFSADIDASLAPAAGIRIEASGGDGRFDDGNERIVPVADVHVSAGNARVLMVRPVAPLAGDEFRLVIGEADGIALADAGGRVLDGDANGHAGGDFAMSFRAPPKDLQ